MSKGSNIPKKRGCRVRKSPKAAAREFLSQLFGAKECSKLHIGLWTRQTMQSQWFPVEELDQAAEWIAQTAQKEDVYVRMTPVSKPPSTGRGKADDAAAFVGVWLDVDIRHDVHQKADQLPPTEEAARNLIDQFPLKPSLLIHSGHGFQAWWILKKPQLLKNAKQRQWAHDISRQFQETMQAHAERLGYTIDSTHDLARVMRIAGTVNRKSDPIPVRVVLQSKRKYRVTDLQQHFLPSNRDQEKTVIVDNLQLDKQATPPTQKLNALLRNDRNFKNTWSHKRKDLPSLSEYDQAIANRLVKAGWEDQEIADAIIAFRRKHGDNQDLRKAMRKDYIKSTIITARNNHTSSTTKSSDGFYELFTLDELENMPPQEWLIQGILPAQSMNVLYGPSNAGKSFVALDFTLSVAAGIPWLNRKVKQGPCVYIAAEGSSGFKARVEAWRQAHPQSEPDVRFLFETVRLLDHDDVSRLMNTIRTLDPFPTLLVVDTMARVIAGGDENSAQDVGLLVDALDTIRHEFQCAILIIHHTAKNGKVQRGSSALRAAADTMMQLCFQDGILRLGCDKAKDAAPFKRIGLLLKTVEVGPDGDTSCQVISTGFDRKSLPNSTEHKLMDAAESIAEAHKSGVRWSELKSATDLPKSSFDRVLEKLVKKRRLIKTGSVRNTRYKLATTRSPPKTSSSSNPHDSKPQFTPAPLAP